jgi:hypothetical protein
MPPKKLTLTIDQTIEFTKTCAEMDGFVAGAQAMSAHLKNLLVQSLAQKQPEAPPAQPSGEHPQVNTPQHPD